MSGKHEANELVTDTFSPRQHGQPLREVVRLPMGASHSWSGPPEHCHQNFLCEPATTWSGVTSPFLVGCHCAAISGKRVRREFVTEVFLPAQHGQPAPFAFFIRFSTLVCHSWSGLLGHRHQNFLCEPAGTLSGVTSPFLVGCHWAATSGNRVRREFVTEAFFPAQHGQPVPFSLFVLL